MGEDSAIRADTRTAEKSDVSSDADSRSQLDLASDESEGPDTHVGRKNRSVFDTCGRMDVGQGFSSFR